MKFLNRLKKNKTTDAAGTLQKAETSISNLEKSGLILFKNKKYYPALFIFGKLVIKEPGNTNAWYGLGNCLAITSASLKKPGMLKLAVACFKKAVLMNNGKHVISQDFLNTIQKTKQLSADKIKNTDPATGEDIETIPSTFDFNQDSFIAGFSGLNEKDRMVIIVFLGETGDPFFYPLLRHAITKEKDIHVRYAALKRIHLYREPDLEQVFTLAIKNQKGDELEPYLSIALNLINEPWTEKFKGSAYQKLYRKD